MGRKKEVFPDRKLGEVWVEGSDSRQKARRVRGGGKHRDSAYTFARSLEYLDPVHTRQILQSR